MTRSKLHHRLAAALGLGTSDADADAVGTLLADGEVQAAPRALTIDQVVAVLSPDQSGLGDASPSAGLADLGVVELAERLVQALRRRDARHNAETPQAQAMADPAAEHDDLDDEDFALAPAAGATMPISASLMRTASPASETTPSGPLVIFPSQMVSAATRPFALGGIATAAHRPQPDSSAATAALEAALTRLLHTNVHD